MRKAQVAPSSLALIEQDERFVPSKGWAEMIRKVYETDPLISSKCQSQMRIITFVTDYPVVDRILNHLKLTFVADKPPPPRFAFQEVLMTAEAGGEYLSLSSFCPDGNVWMICGSFGA